MTLFNIWKSSPASIVGRGVVEPLWGVMLLPHLQNPDDGGRFKYGSITIGGS